jgi:hypothetical protein
MTIVAPPARAQTRSVTVTVQQRTSANVLDSTFNGLSFERTDFTGPTFSANDTDLVKLFKMLGPGVLHSGGTSTEETAWDRNGGLTKNSYTMTPPDVDRVASFLRATNWKMIYSLNFTIGKPPLNSEPSTAQIEAAAENEANEAAYVASSFGDRLVGFEIGNEPDLFYKNGIRGPNYTFANYENEWKIWVKAIKAKVPNAVFVGPGASSMWGPWVGEFVPALGGEVSLVTDHYYGGSAVESDPIQMILTNSGFYGTNYNYLSTYMLPTLDTLAQSASVGYRVDETNAFGGEVVAAAGTEFGTALWAIDFEFLNALNHSSGVNFHNNYPPIATRNASGVVTAVNPMFYGMKLFSMAANGTLVRTAVTTNPTTLSAYAVAANDGTDYVVITNKDGDTAAQTTINFMQPVSSASATILTAPSLTSQSGVKLAGSSIGTNGSWSPKGQSVSIVNGSAVITVPPGSAAFIHAQPLSTTITVPYDGQCVTSTNSEEGPNVLQEACGGSGQNFVFVPTSDGFYNVRRATTALCFDAQSGNTDIIQTACDQSSSQKWKLAKNANNTYTIATTNGKYCFNVENNATWSGANLKAWMCNGATNEQFNLSNPPKRALLSKSSTILMAYDDDCMDVRANSYLVGAEIQQHPCTGAVNEEFAFSSTLDGYYTISSDKSQLCLDASGGNGKVIQNNCTGSGSQKWRLANAGNGTYTLSSQNPHTCLEMAGQSSAPSTLFSVASCNGGTDQKFRIPYAPPVY